MVCRRLFVISRAALFVIAGLLMTPRSGAARQAAPASPPSAAVSAIAPDDEIRRTLVKRIDTDKQSLGIVVGILEPKGRRLVAHGRPAKEDARPLNGDTVFEIGSVTKVFTALLLADMVQRGEVAITDPIAKYLPAGKVPERGGRSITLQDLVTHTSGLPRMPTNFAPKDPSNPVPHWDFPPGTSAVAGAGGLRSTADDLLAFLEAHLGVTKSTLAPAIATLLETRRPTNVPRLQIAMGWHVATRPGDREIVWHNGGTGGYRSFVGYDRNAGLGVVVLSNTSTPVGVDDIGMHLLDPRAPLFTPPPPRTAVSADPALFDGGDVTSSPRISS